MSTPRHSAALVVSVFLAVAAVLVGTTAAIGWQDHGKEAPAGSSNVHRPPANPARDILQGAAPVPGSLASRIPDTSVAAGDDALHARPGVLVARGHQFRIERVALTSPAHVVVRGKSVTAHSVYRITITAGPYQVRDMAAVVSINGRPLAVGMESRDLSSLMAFTFDDSVLTDGATLAVSYGLPNSTTTTWTSAIEVTK